MGKRSASSKATRGVSKARHPGSSSSSNPKTTKFRSQYNSLAAIAKGAPSRKALNKDAIKRVAKNAAERQQLLNGLENFNLIDLEEGGKKKNHNKISRDNSSIISGASKFTTASFASMWSNCTNSSLNEFFQVWNPKLETHKDALAVIAGLSQVMSNSGTEQSDLDFAKTLFKIISSSDVPSNVLTGSLLALTFVMRKLSVPILNDKFDDFYPILKGLMENHHATGGKTLVKCLIRCFACLTKAHPLGKESIESALRKKINIAIRRTKVQSKISL